MMFFNKYICKLTREEKEFAKSHLNETDENRPEGIKGIRQWLQNTPGMISRTDDFYILRFLRVCKFEVEKTKTRIKNFLKVRADCPEWFTNRDPLTHEMQEILDLGIYLPLKEVDKENRTVLFERMCLHDPNRHSIASLMKVATATTDLAMNSNESVTLYGVAIVIDLQGMTWGHALQATPNELKRIVHITHDCYPIEVKSYNFVNVPWHLAFVIEIVRAFSSEQMRSRFFIHSDDKALLEKFPREILPTEYGGTNGSIDNLRDYWKKQLENNRDWIIDDEKYKLSK